MIRKLFLASILLNLGLGFWLWRNRLHTLASEVPPAVQNLEKIEFLRNFFDHYFQYRSSNFLNNQASILTFFSDSLRDEKRIEIQKIQSKLSAQEVEQNHSLRELVRVGENEYLGYHLIELTTAESGVKKFALKTSLILRAVPREPENPRGLQIVQIKIEPDFDPHSEGSVLSLGLKSGGTNLVEFPCVIQRLDGENTERMRIQVSGLKKTTLEVSPEETWSGETRLQASCDRNVFKLNFHAASQTQSVYRRIFGLQAKPAAVAVHPPSANLRVAAVKMVSPPSPEPQANLLHAILEQQLGFVIQPVKKSK